MAPEPYTFLDPQRLLDSSLPRPRNSWVWYGLAIFTMVVLTSTFVGQRNPQAQVFLRVLGGITMLGVVVAMGLFTSYTVRLQRQEQQRVEAVEELVQLRKWDQAAATLDSLLGQPMRSPGARLQSLIYLTSVLARYHRFDDAVAVQKYLLENAELDPGTTHGLKLMRAMSMLHEDHLFDADRAINDLRRETPDSAGLALIDLYRDVKTGHPREAIDLFHARLPELRKQLGHRVADAWALAARCHDLLDESPLAQDAWSNATLLSPVDELCRRYPELLTLREKYPATPRPEVAA